MSLNPGCQGSKGIYLLMLRHAAVDAQGAVQKLPMPKELSQALYNNFLRLADVGLRDAASTHQAPNEAESQGLTAFVAGDTEADRQLCVRAMAAVYHEHAAAVGECAIASAS